MSFLPLARASIALLPLLLGCSSPAPASKPGAALGFDDFLKQSQQAACERLVQCGEVPDIATCFARGLGEIAAGPRSQSWCLVGDVTAGRVTYDSATAEACLQELRTGECNYGQNIPLTGAACRSVFSGTVALGGACLGDAADVCVAQTSCFFESGRTNGKCIHEHQIGEACTNDSGNGCGDDALCVSGVCEARPAAGQPCVFDLCAAGSTCDQATQLCARVPGLGEACDPSLGDSCADPWNVDCDEVTSRCVARPSIGKACTPATRCRGDAYCSGGVCQWFPSEGEACLMGDGSSGCALGLDCNGVCSRAAPRTCE